MTQQRLTVARVINAPVEKVWDVLTDIPNAARRLSGIDDVQMMTSGPYAVGTRWRETRTFFGRTATEEMWVRFNDPLRSTVIEASNGGVDYRSTWRLREIGSEKTELVFDFTAKSPDKAVANAVATVVGPLGLRATSKAMEQDVDDIAHAVAHAPAQQKAKTPRAEEL